MDNNTDYLTIVNTDMWLQYLTLDSERKDTKVILCRWEVMAEFSVNRAEVCWFYMVVFISRKHNK